MYDLIDAARRYIDCLRQMILTHLHRLVEILEQDLTRMDGRKVSGRQRFSSLTIDDLDVKGVIVTPHETHTPLIVNANAVLPSTIMA